ncbi:type II CRISPR-associated endonuclease Cas1 [Microvirga sp. W0021]|uniref:CRISPR-associated endonuclease Cas1 n=1 Tax=Hohaiivirga grylli TaxID=3133970 RepID=A0ABV0BI34_9HYPH
MLGQIVEVTGEGRHLSLERGFLKISMGSDVLGKVPLDDIEAVIVAHPAASLTTQVLAALAQRSVPVVISNEAFRPCSCLLPIDGHFAQGKRIEAQAEVSLPVRKRLWADIIKAKIKAQAAALEHTGKDASLFYTMSNAVRSGDVDNLEAQAARRYFPEMFGKNFYRYRDGGGVNAALNYGYTVLRAATARAIVANGLHPSLSLKHQSAGEALRLADDLMEPFRPAVDIIAYQMSQVEDFSELDVNMKRQLSAVLHADYETEDALSPLSNVLNRMCSSLAQVFTGERAKIWLPVSSIPVSEKDEAFMD